MLKWKKYTFLIVGTIAILFGIYQIAAFFIVLFGPVESTCGRGIQAAAVKGEEDIVMRSGPLESQKLSFTCNVDWGEEVLPGMLDTLKEKDIKITFFICGRWAEKNPSLLRRMYVEGHEIQSHGYSHKLSTKISKEQEKEEMEKTEDAIALYIGEKPSVYAPPSGDYDSETLELCREMNYKLSLWSSDTIDWKPGSTKDIIKERILKKDLSGAIVLMHPKPETAKALPEMIDEIQQKNITIVPLREMGIY
ncbi:polysaccharide deacetylase family protein [Sinanaerobacter sp. ZZT-01]|uniref:polysaccharide deacetylase family protein n=1 Tax=Sinanaerobacter sp. ZZT-01 TaxID=3111540 RepID=UPI002D79DA20|nr:polysaccharide deacetylase family protein [Sinanaerobacter sp. ZZT-01]WRR93220.1 polysaccharide deacetylase family protein [Sinanaerobacter sp. ZZT-01]